MLFSDRNCKFAWFFMVNKLKKAIMLKKILAISGKPGLYKLVSNTGNALIVESLVDGKRFPAYAASKVISLDDISVFTEEEDVPLRDIFKAFYTGLEGKEGINHKDESKNITDFFGKLVPTYDKDRVYVSDMRKMIQWYNLLLSKNVLDFSVKSEETVESNESEKSED